MTLSVVPVPPFLDAPIGRTLAKLTVPGITASVIQASMDVVEAYLGIIGPFYGFFGLGLDLYFGGQGLDSLIFPVLGTVVRLLILNAFDALTQEVLFGVVAATMTT